MSEVWLATAFFSVSNLKACRTSELEGQQHVLLIERVVSSILKNAQGLLNGGREKILQKHIFPPLLSHVSIRKK